MKQLFKALFKRVGSVIINGTSYSGGSVVISGNIVGGDVYVDGVRQVGSICFKAPMSIKSRATLSAWKREAAMSR